KGAVSEPDIHDMSEFVTQDSDVVLADDKVSHSFYRHVAILDGPTPNAVDVLFSDPHTNSFYRATMRPIADVRIRIPVGSHPGPRLGGPHSLNVDWTGRAGTITSRDGNTIIFCNSDGTTLHYVKLSGGKWSALQSVALTDQVTAEAAMAALGKMVAASEYPTTTRIDS